MICSPSENARKAMCLPTGSPGFCRLLGKANLRADIDQMQYVSLKGTPTITGQGMAVKGIHNMLRMPPVRQPHALLVLQNLH